MDNNIPQWVIDYNNAGHQSSAGRAINILMSELTRLRSELQQKDEEIVRLKNDLADALDVKNGNGPTALSMLTSELQQERDKVRNQAIQDCIDIVSLTPGDENVIPKLEQLKTKP